MSQPKKKNITFVSTHDFEGNLMSCMVALPGQFFFRTHSPHLLQTVLKDAFAPAS